MWSLQRILYGLSGLLGVAARSSPPDYLQEHLSFGQYSHLVWTDDHQHVAGFQLTGDHGHHPELLSDRIILTPAWPGSKRAAIWADSPLYEEVWTVLTEFRAAGAEHASGNMQIWYVKDKHEVNFQSIYTVGKFDGLVIVIDQYGGYGGSVRGFLNDGTISYKDHHHVDSLSFGHCTVHYRNSGHYVSLEIKQTARSFEVIVDGHHCFHSKKIKTHPGSYFGISAASAEHPDSFETKSFIVHSSNHDDEMHGASSSGDHHDPYNPSHFGATHHPDPHRTTPPISHPHFEKETHQKDPNDKYADRDWDWINERERLKDVPADTLRTERDRFEDLHARIQLLTRQVDLLYHDMSELKEQQENALKEQLTWLSPIHDYAATNKYTLERLEGIVEQFQKDFESKSFKKHLDELFILVSDSHDTIHHGIMASLHSHLQTSHPRFGFFVFLVIASQVMLLGSYIVYRYRMKRQPKKYL